MSPRLEKETEVEFQQDFDELQRCLKDWTEKVSESYLGNTQVPGEHSLGDLVERSRSIFSSQLENIMKKYPDKTGKIRSVIFELSQDRNFTHISNPDQLKNFGGEVRGIFSPQSDEYSKL